MKLSRKQLRKLILKEFRKTAGSNLPPNDTIDRGEGGGGGLTPCENFDSESHQKSLKIIRSLFQQAYEIRGETYNFLKQKGGYSEDQLFAIDSDAEVYLESDLATELCKAGRSMEKRMQILVKLTQPKVLFMMLNNY